MRDIDLIPADYVQARQVRRMLMIFGAVLLLLVLATAGFRGWIAVRLAGERAAAAQARQLDTALGVQRARLAGLRVARDAGDAQLATLSTLLDARPADALWNAVDAAYNPRIWLEAMSYARTAQADTGAAPGSPSAAAPAAVASAGLALRHDVELRGHALDHAALSEFRRALGDRPGVASVRLAESGLQQFAGRDVVRFTMTATLAAAAAAPGTLPGAAPGSTPGPAPASLQTPAAAALPGAATTLASTGRAP